MFNSQSTEIKTISVTERVYQRRVGYQIFKVDLFYLPAGSIPIRFRSVSVTVLGFGGTTLYEELVRLAKFLSCGSKGRQCCNLAVYFLSRHHTTRYPCLVHLGVGVLWPLAKRARHLNKVSGVHLKLWWDTIPAESNDTGNLVGLQLILQGEF